MIADLELFSLRRHFQRDGLLTSYRSKLFFLPRSLNRLLQRLKDNPRFVSVCVLVRLLFATAILITSLRGSTSLTALIGYTLSSGFLAIRGNLGSNGSDQMFSILMLAAFIGSLRGTHRDREAALFFIAAQLSISYAAAAVVKLTSPSWRRGKAFVVLMRTEVFGNPHISRLLGLHPRIPALLSMAFLVAELTFTVAPWTPPPVCASLLSVAFLFHCGVAYSMGLNTFLFAFVSAFPAAIYTSHRLYH